MGVNFFQNGASIGASAAWGGYTGGNNYVVRYDFVTPSAGASSVTLTLGGIYNGHNAGTQGFGFKISTSGTAFANARAQTPDSTLGYMSYSSQTGYGCTMTAENLNLAGSTSYYIFVYLATAGAEYYTGWNCTAPVITLSGSYTPPNSQINSVSAQVSTQSAVSVIMNRSGGCWHKASFYYNGALLGVSAPFSSALSHACPRSWLSNAPSEKSIRIDLAVQSYAEESCVTPTGEIQTAYFILTADEGMHPEVDKSAVSVTSVNSGAAAGFTEMIALVSRINVSFDASKISLAACAGAQIASYGVSVNGKTVKSTSAAIDIGTVNEACTLICSVTDTRGREGSVSVNITPVAYVPPSLGEIEAARCNASGEADEAGAYIKIRATQSFTALDGNNSAAVKASIQPTGGSIGAETALTGFESGKWSDKWASPTLLGGALTGDSYTVHLRVTDTVGGEAKYTVRLYHQQWAMKFNENGTAIGLGMAPTATNAVMVAASWRLYTAVPVLGEGAYGTSEPSQAVQNPVEGQLYFKLKE